MAFITLSQLTKAVKGLVNKINLESNVTNSKIGQLPNLSTTSKDNLVEAVNEVTTNIPTKVSDLTNDSEFFHTAEWIDPDGESVEQTGAPGTFTPRGSLSLPSYFTPRIFNFTLAADGTVTGPGWSDVASVESSSIIYADMTTPQGYTQRLICVQNQDADAAHNLTIVFMGLDADGAVLMLRSHPTLDSDHINSWVYEKMVIRQS